MSDERARPTRLDDADLEERIRALERQVSEAQPRSLARKRHEDELRPAVQGRRDADSPAAALLTLLAGLALMGGGLLLFMTRIVVWSGFWFMGGQPPLALLLVPFILGVGLMLGGGRVVRYLGIALAGLSVAGIIGVSFTILHLYFAPTPLLTVLGMLALIGVGLGLAIRGVRRL